jgi:deoxyribose-phosphate aldolase
MAIVFDDYSSVTQEKIDKKLKSIYDYNIPGMDRKDMLKLILNCVDLTTLEGSDNNAKVTELCKKAVELQPNVAAVCIYPPFVKLCKTLLQGKNISVASVAGAFPSGQSPIKVKLQEIQYAIDEGADDIDMVISRGKFLEGNYKEVADEITAIKDICKNVHLKVILETGELQTIANIRKASELAINAGGDFIKTSTGKIPVGATETAALVMVETIKEYYEKTGKLIGFKPAGGIATCDHAINYLKIVHYTLGDKWMSNKLFRVGASRLAVLISGELNK